MAEMQFKMYWGNQKELCEQGLKCFILNVLFSGLLKCYTTAAGDKCKKVFYLLPLVPGQGHKHSPEFKY